MKQLLKISPIYLLSFVIIFIFTTCGAFYLSNKFLEPKAYDFVTKITATQKGSSDIVNVAIDEKSLYEIGRWPWGRTKYADIINYLTEYGKAKIIVFDTLIVSNEDKKSDTEFVNRIKGNDKLITGINFIKSQNSSDLNQNNDKTLEEKFSIKVNDKRTENSIKKSKYNDYIGLLPEYFNNVGAIGSVGVTLSADGIIRKIEPIINYNNSYYPSLALAVLLKHNKPESIELDENFLYLKYKDKKTQKIYVNPRTTITTLIRWYKPYEYRTLSAHKEFSAWEIIKAYNDIKAGKKPFISPEEFKDKIVVIGATAAVLHDIKTTSMGTNYPGIDIQSTFIDNIINDYTFTTCPMWIRALVSLITIGITFISIITFPPVYSFMSILLMMMAYFYVAFINFQNGFVMNIITPYIFVLLTLILGYAYRFSKEDNAKKKIKKAMEKYVSKNVVSQVITDTEEIKLGGEKVEITVLFADIRGFTGISEDLSPEIVTELLNEYFCAMLPIIEKYNGVLNKFMGDAILAIFGEPIKDSKHPENAVLCAYEMIEEVQKIKNRWKKEGKPKIDIGIGINTGIAFIGNIGTQERLEYTVIGDTVNVANRIESQNKIYNTKLLISETTYERVKKLVDTIKISSVSIRGREKLIDIYEIIDLLNPASLKK